MEDGAAPEWRVTCIPLLREVRTTLILIIVVASAELFHKDAKPKSKRDNDRLNRKLR